MSRRTDKEEKSKNPSATPNWNRAVPPRLSGRYRWLDFIEEMRRGGVDAVMKCVKEKAEIIRNLPLDQNNILGVSFEELQIAKIMAESIRNRIPLELIAGDGNGKFRYNNADLKSPEYTDAVFLNKSTGEYLAVQFKYTDTAENLFEMMTRHHDKWSTRQPDARYPEALKFDNVRIIGPKDVSPAVDTRNMSEALRRNFEESQRLNFAKIADHTDTMEKFLKENKGLMDRILDGSDYAKLEILKGNKKTLETFHDQIVKKMKSLEEAKLETPPLQNKIRGIENSIDKLNNYKKSIETINELERKVEGGKQSTTVTEAWENNIKDTETCVKKVRATVEQSINMKYCEGHMRSTIRRDLRTTALVSAAVDGITTLICTCGSEYEDYRNGRISFKQMALEVTKQTAFATGRGAAIGLGFGGLTSLAQYATLHGWRLASVFTGVAEKACPVIAGAVVLKQSYDYWELYHQGHITGEECAKACARTLTTNVLSVGGMMVAGAAIGGPVGMAVGAGVAIAVGIGDYFFGDKLWGCHPDANTKKDVLEMSYAVLGLSKTATRAEVKKSYKEAIRKCHPDKGGTAERFTAVQTAYVYICEHTKQ